MKRSDSGALAATLADDLAWTHSTGRTEDKTQFVDRLRAGRVTYERLHASDIEVRVHGDVAIVTGVIDLQALSNGERTAYPLRFADVMMRRNGRWQTVVWQGTQTSRHP